MQCNAISSVSPVPSGIRCARPVRAFVRIWCGVPVCNALSRVTNDIRRTASIISNKHTDVRARDTERERGRECTMQMHAPSSASVLHRCKHNHGQCVYCVSSSSDDFHIIMQTICFTCQNVISTTLIVVYGHSGNMV